jgi:MFS family permease
MRAPAAPLSAASIVRRYYGVWLVYSLAGGFLAGVYPLFLRSRGLNQFEINSLLAMYFAVTFLLDVPTGAFADAIGRRLAFVLGCAMRCLGFGLYFVSHTYVLFLVAETIDAIGTAFCNGAIDAWGVDALDEAGFEGTKDRLFSRISQLSSLGFMATALVGALVAQIDIAWPWLLGAGGFVVSGLFGTLLRERPRLASGGGHRAMREAIGARIGAGLRRGFSIRSVRLLSYAEAIVLALWAPYWLEWPLLFKDGYGAGVWVVGWIFCVLGLGRMIGAEAAARMVGVAPRRPRLLSGLMIASGALLAGAGFAAGRPNVALALLFLMNVFQGAREPLALSWFNEQLEPEERATMLSFRGTMATAGGSMGLLLGGYVADLRGIPFAWKLAGTLSLVAVPCYLTLRPRPSLTAPERTLP